jgi:hypothetical protein
VYGDNIFDTDQVELTLEPVGKLIDGSTRQEIVRRLEVGPSATPRTFRLAATALRPATCRRARR